MLRSRPVLIDAPSNLGLSRPEDGREPGCRGMPKALRAAGILHAIGAEDGGMVAAPPYSDDRPSPGKVRNAAAIASFSRRLADHLEPLVAGHRLPVVLGGDCSILLGSMLALRRRGTYGLIFMDGHLDFRHPGNAEVVGAAAGEDLALVTGRGQRELTDLEGLRPLVRDGDVVALGFREGPAEADAEDILDTEVKLLSFHSVRSRGPQEVASDCLRYLSERRLDGVWIHVDVDVLDSDLMPAVDSPAPGGLSWEEFEAILSELLNAPLPVGVQFTIFDPDLDPDGMLARRLVQAISRGLTRAVAPGGQ